MAALFDKISLLPHRKRLWTAVAITFTVATLLTVWGIYGIGQYGLALFVLTPMFVGFSSAALYGYKHSITRRTAFRVSLLTISLMTIGLLVCAIEGIICIVMAAPIALLLVWVGSMLGHILVSRKPPTTANALLALALFIPLTGFVESRSGMKEGDLKAVHTSVRINASREEVWKHVTEFPELAPPHEFLFKAGIAYPINASIKGQGVGAIRYCNFSTGSFVEPITSWQVPELLSFDVEQCPRPMTELSFWDVDAPHLHEYFVSKKGQFRLIRISDHETLLEGTTWYHNRIKPNFYWNLWSDYIVHAIHERVLNHIKQTSELESTSNLERDRINHLHYN
jgi:hypothetical protein